jgi:hypothetical protein
MRCESLSVARSGKKGVKVKLDHFHASREYKVWYTARKDGGISTPTLASGVKFNQYGTGTLFVPYDDIVTVQVFSEVKDGCAQPDPDDIDPIHEHWMSRIEEDIDKLDFKDVASPRSSELSSEEDECSCSKSDCSCFDDEVCSCSKSDCSCLEYDSRDCSCSSSDCTCRYVCYCSDSTCSGYHLTDEEGSASPSPPPQPPRKAVLPPPLPKRQPTKTTTKKK